MFRAICRGAAAYTSLTLLYVSNSATVSFLTGLPASTRATRPPYTILQQQREPIQRVAVWSWDAPAAASKSAAADAAGRCCFDLHDTVGAVQKGEGDWRYKTVKGL